MQFNLKNDVIFKAFFSRKGNEKYLLEFLEALLKIKIKKIKIKEEVNLEKLFQEEKGGRLDLLAELNDGILVDIEMQVEKQTDFLERTARYAYKMLSQEAGNGLKYGKMKQTILINILDFEIFPTNEYISRTVNVLENCRNYEVIKNPQWYFIELSKFRKINPDMNDPLNQWLLFIDDYDRGKIKMAETKNKTLKQARETMNYLTGDEEIRRLAELREKWAMDRYFDIKNAKEEGRKEIIKEMLKNGINIKTIAKCTDLTEEEILRIQT